MPILDFTLPYTYLHKHRGCIHSMLGFKRRFTMNIILRSMNEVGGIRIFNSESTAGNHSHPRWPKELSDKIKGNDEKFFVSTSVLYHRYFYFNLTMIPKVLPFHVCTKRSGAGMPYILLVYLHSSRNGCFCIRAFSIFSTTKTTA